MQSGRGAGDLEAANNLHALAAGGGRKKPSAVRYVLSTLRVVALPPPPIAGSHVHCYVRYCLRVHWQPGTYVPSGETGCAVFPQLPTADNIQYWRQPEKAGWLQCQGEKMGLWRKRWFVLKQGHLFRRVAACVTAAVSVGSICMVANVPPTQDNRCRH